MTLNCRRALALICLVAASSLLAACGGGHPHLAGMAGMAGQHTPPSSVSTTATPSTATSSPPTTTTSTTALVAAAGRAALVSSLSPPGAPPASSPPARPPTAPVPPAPGPPAPPTTSLPKSPPPTSPPPTYPWPPPSGALPPGPPPTNYGPYGGYGLWYGTCQNTGGEFGYGQITTHWDEYRGTASVQYLEIAAGFSSTSTPRQPVPGATYTNLQNVNNPTWGKPIPVGARHQDGPLYLEFKSPTPHSVISVMFYWLDANQHVLWQSPAPLIWSC